MNNALSTFRYRFGSTGKNATNSLNSTGGTKITSGSDVYHVFLYDGTFSLEGRQISASKVLIVSGGGSGGNGQSGGGGGGSAVYSSSYSIQTGNYPIVVGGGGATSDPSPSYADNGNRGGNSSAFGVTALGGGAGSKNNYAYDGQPGPEQVELSGGNSGGGGGGFLFGPSVPMSGAVTPQPVPGSFTLYGGNSGAPAANTGDGSGGGGAGAGGASPGPGPTRPSSTASPGGPGAPFPEFPAPVLAPAIPAPVRSDWTTAVGPTGLFGGGGGGGDDNTSSGGGSGGPGGGGQGGDTDNNVSTGVQYTGGGGGSASGPGTSPWLPTSGGDGIVIIKYTI